MFEKLIARRDWGNAEGFSKSRRGNQLVRVASEINEARKTGIQKAGRRSLQWVRREVLASHAKKSLKAQQKMENLELDVGGARFRVTQGEGASECLITDV